MLNARPLGMSCPTLQHEQETDGHELSHIRMFYRPSTILRSEFLVQESLKAAPFLQDLDVFTGTFEGTTVLPKGTADSERLGKLQGKKITLIETAHWAPGKCAQITDVTYQIDGSETILGTTLFGWDQTKNTITYTQYTTHKGVWSGTVSKDGDKWIFTYEGYNLDGHKCIGKRIVNFTDKDHYTLLDTDQTLDGKPELDVTWQFQRL